MDLLDFLKMGLNWFGEDTLRVKCYHCGEVWLRENVLRFFISSSSSKGQSSC